MLRTLKLRFKILVPHYKEETNQKLSPSGIVKLHAFGKAQSVADKVKNGTILSADTVVYFRGKIIGKPRSLKEAFQILSSLQGKWHAVYTGAAVLFVENGKIRRQKTFAGKTKVFLKKMSAGEIRAYFKKVNPLDKAGAYAIQSKQADIVERIRGSFFNVVGLPLEQIGKILLK